MNATWPPRGAKSLSEAHGHGPQGTSVSGSPMAPLLEVRHLCVEFASHGRVVRALDDVSLSLGPGEILGVVGESGAGKSLTGAAVIGLLDPPGRVAHGEIWLAGQRIDGLDAEALRRLRGRQIGAVFQDPLTALNPLMSVGQQLVETLRTHLPMGASEARLRAEALLAQMGVPAPAQRLDQYPHQFSGGMRQRVVIALALAAEPRLLIADEPTTALDVSVQAQVMNLISRQARERGMGVMLVTHDMGVIAEYCDRVAVMYAGRTVECGPVRSVLQRPHHPYTAGLLGAIPSLRSVGGRLVQIDGAMPRPEARPGGCDFHPRCWRARPNCQTERPVPCHLGRTEVSCWWPLGPDGEAVDG